MKSAVTRALEHARELAALVHLGDDVAAADELAADIELRVRLPVRVLLEALTNVAVGQDVEGVELDALFLEDLDDGVREAAGGELPRALP